MNTPETDAELNLYLRHGEAHQLSVPWIEFSRKLERERDDAREKINRQANRIRYLEGATNHACGTPLSVALRERDEARQALMKIDDLFIDGTDIYADRENMGMIAKTALEETK
jgi:hypothetical protein